MADKAEERVKVQILAEADQIRSEIREEFRKLGRRERMRLLNAAKYQAHHPECQPTRAVGRLAFAQLVALQAEEIEDGIEAPL